MSNFLAVATVSAALQLHLQDAVRNAVAGSDVWVDRSDVKRQKSGVNIYMYRMSFDAARRNDDLPSRRDDGSLRTKPTAAVSLHYLLTFHGKDDELEPQRLLGATLAALHSRPLLSSQLIDDVVAAATDNPPSHPYLATSDLADALDIVRVTPDPLSVDELSKVWSVFFQTAYQLSATYTATAVLVEESQGTVVPAPPVLDPQLAVRPLLQPTITSALNAADPRAPIVADTVLAVRGSGLRGDQTLVRIGSEELTPNDTDISATLVRADLSTSTDLRPGLQPVAVAQGWLVGDPLEPRGGELSNAVAVVVCPRITTAIGGDTLTVTSDLTVGSRQQASVALLVPATGVTVRVIDVAPRTLDATDVTVSVAGVPNGEYGVQLQVDGALSPVTRNGAGVITAPVVSVS